MKNLLKTLKDTLALMAVFVLLFLAFIMPTEDSVSYEKAHKFKVKKDTIFLPSGKR